MQECDKESFNEWFNPKLADRYTGLFVKKSSSRSSDGLALWFLTDRFAQLDVLSKRILAAENQVFAALALQLKATGEKLCVATTHLKAAKSAAGEVTRTEEVGVVLDALQGFSQKHAIDRVIFTGDLNASPHDEGYPPTTYAATLRHSLQLSSAYASALGEEPPYTSWKLRPGKEQCITEDYIFFSQSIAVSSVLDIPRPEEIDACRLPNEAYASDHFLLAAELLL